MNQKKMCEQIVNTFKTICVRHPSFLINIQINIQGLKKHLHSPINIITGLVGNHLKF